MQRKNSFLRRSRHRNGMAMIMAVAIIVIIATVMALSLSLTSQTSKRTTDLYLYEQSALYAKSAAELALLQISQNGPCSAVTIPPFDIDIYDVNVTTRYIYTSPLPSGCINDGSVNDNVYAIVTTNEQNGSVLMDITVSTDAGTEPITYFRRTIQKL